ncbi:hypothetical protein SDRG_12158 [Saprolegnia diclina VS20]|uniref:Uncharacterized protein n=1 Tax=Saprolegnia diclina (strain VS20) TaxID=1156394 RepID=T0PX52_SAPDV|nr:hypothetical protein SDRG_12158 [Saprolegnia diclina VS20]EQC30099.1 hypothetical protein SDRG_12158 [Saprolegnia diclina VS20]|eukprot:XP_008616442.1 hypothetical protein SDRG_12158 [Saprolegnia diclina VS20]
MTTAEYIVVGVIAVVLLLLVGICVRQRRAASAKKDRTLAASLVSSSPLFCGHSRRSLMDLGLPAPSLSLSIVGLRREASSQNDTALSSSDATEYAPPPPVESKGTPKATPTDPALRTFNDDFFVLSQRGGQNGLPLLESTRGDAPPRHISVVESVDEHQGDDEEDEADRPSALWHSFLEEGRSLSVFSGGFSDMDDDDDLNNSFLQPQSYYTESIADDEDDDDQLDLHGVMTDAVSHSTKVDL